MVVYTFGSAADALTAGTLVFEKTSKPGAPDKWSLREAGKRADVLCSAGNPALPLHRNWRVARRPCPPASKPDSNALFVLLEAPTPVGAACEEDAAGATQAEADAVRFGAALVAAAGKVTSEPVEVFIGAKGSPDGKGTPLPFTQMWATVMANCSYANLITKCMVFGLTDEDPAAPYPLSLVLEDMHPAVSGSVSLETFGGKTRVKFRVANLGVSPLEAKTDPDFVPPPMVGGGAGGGGLGGTRFPIALPWANGDKAGFILFGGAACMPPTWVPDTHPDLRTANHPLSMASMADGLADGTIGFKVVPGKDKEGKPCDRVFLNREGYMGNVLTFWGDFGRTAEDQVFVVKAPSVHPGADAEATKAMGSMVAFPAAEDERSWRAVRRGLYAGIKDKVYKTGKKRPSEEALELAVREKYSIPGFDPENPPSDAKAEYVLNEATGKYEDQETHAVAHVVAWLKLNVEAPKSIQQLLTGIFLLNRPGDEFSCEPATVADVTPGRPVVTICEWSELKDQKGQRIVNYCKAVFLVPRDAIAAVSGGGAGGPSSLSSGFADASNFFG